MRVTVIPVDVHYKNGRLDYSYSGLPVDGQRLVVTPEYVMVDRRKVLTFDPAPELVFPVPHNWMDARLAARDSRSPTGWWTGFRVEVEP